MHNSITPRSIYLDHAAATPLSDAAVVAMQEQFATCANPSSFHHLGRTAFDALAESRRLLADSLQVEAEELIFTGSGTESDNLAICGIARAYREQGKHIIVSGVEHKAVLASAKQLETEGFVVTYLSVDGEGMVLLDELKQALQPDTILVSVMYANNEIGTIQPIQEVVRICAEYRKHTGGVPLVHTDACQAVGLLPVLPKELGVDAMTVNGAKCYGPKGIGLLYLSSGIKVQPLIVGGNQECGRRAGTESVMLAAGFAAALVEAVENTALHTDAMRALQNHFVTELQKFVPGIQFNGHPTQRLANNVHVTIPDIEGESLVLLLSEYGICAATGSACSAQDLEPSHVLTAIGQDEQLIHGSLRFSFGRATTKDDLRYTARILGEVTQRLRAMTASTTTAYTQTKSV